MSERFGVRTDLYQLTMMQGYWAAGRQADRAAFELLYRSIPDEGGYVVAAGIEDAIDAALEARFHAEELDYLRSLELFDPNFLAFLADLRFTGSIRAVAEGSLVFPQVPLLEVTGPLIEAQWLETLLLNLINFESLIATKASRMVAAARPARILEFGLRRAHGPNGGLLASRAAYLGGCSATSNVEAGFRFGIPVVGTHAHSWVMSFPTEREAFTAYARVFPDHTVLLVDTYDPIRTGIPNAVAVGLELAQQGKKLKGIRLDSGDLAYQAKFARTALDQAGLTSTQIIASNDVDEWVIQDLKRQQAPIDGYGVGTRLVTSFSTPALGGVYKLVALQRTGAGSEETWSPRLKVSSNPAKTTLPGQKEPYRWIAGGVFQGDIIALLGEAKPIRFQHPEHEHLATEISGGSLLPLWTERVREGVRCQPRISLTEARSHLEKELEQLPAEHRRLANPHLYHVGVSPSLADLRARLIREHFEVDPRS